MRNLNTTTLIACGLILAAFAIATDGFQNVNIKSLIVLGLALFFAVLLSLLFHFFNRPR